MKKHSKRDDRARGDVQVKAALKQGYGVRIVETVNGVLCPLDTIDPENLDTAQEIEWQEFERVTFTVDSGATETVMGL